MEKRGVEEDKKCPFCGENQNVHIGKVKCRVCGNEFEIVINEQGVSVVKL